MQIGVHQHTRARRRKDLVRPAAPLDDPGTLIRPDPLPEPVAQGIGRRRLKWRRRNVIHPLKRLVQLAEEARELTARLVPIDRVDDIEQGCARDELSEEKQWIGAARNDLRQVRHRRFAGQGCQYGDLMCQPKRRRA